MSFEFAIGGMADIPQWFIWRLQWDATHAKFIKTPCALDGSVYMIDAGDPANWHEYDVVDAAVRRLDVPGGELRYARGFRLTEGCGYWFLDLDGVSAGDGVLSPLALQVVAAFPNAMMEWSSSGRGIHIFGKGTVPAHSTRPPSELRKAGYNWEFYTSGRGIAFGLDGVAQGDANTSFDMSAFCAQYFPPRAAGGDGERRLDWRGPEDDDVLIERMLNARVSAAAAFGNKASLPQLWRGEVEHTSEHDQALAAHLAFWTGCDAERMERLMRRSGLKRDKWDVHRTYLRDLTITNAIAMCNAVYQEPERNLAVQHEMYAPATAGPSIESLTTTTHVQGDVVSPELFARVEELMGLVSGCGTEPELHNQVIPAIRAAGIPMVFQDKLVNAVSTKLKFWDNRIAIGKLRALLFPPAMRQAVVNDLPDWAKDWCFVGNGDMFFNTRSGQQLSFVGFNATFGHLMPITDQGRRENAAEKCIHFWGMEKVAQIGYRPDQPAFFDFEGKRYANMYSPCSLPAVSPYTPEGVAGIEAYQAHLLDMCGRRQDVYLKLIYWFAHNVQHPGVKIRWSPIIKGCHGDGKTLMTEVLSAAMGGRNIGITGNSTLTANGGFTDWAVGSAVNIMEEIRLVGALRHQLYNAMKEFISNKKISVHPKGRATYKTWNSTNHWANTNHNDALPMEPTDRRWFVIFTPWATLDDMRRYCGLDDAAWTARTQSIEHAFENCAGELRQWFLSIPIPADFDINGSAMMTPEKMLMMASSVDDAESVAETIINDGGHGISTNVLSSSCLTNIMRVRSLQDGFEMPKGHSLNHMLTRLGYSKLPKQVKWRGATHTVWIKNGFSEDNDSVRLELDRTSGLSTQTQLKPENYSNYSNGIITR